MFCHAAYSGERNMPCFRDLLPQASEAKQPQFVDLPFFKLVHTTTRSVPHSHRQSHRATERGPRPAKPSTVHRPNTLPVRSTPANGAVDCWDMTALSSRVVVSRRGCLQHAAALSLSHCSR